MRRILRRLAIPGPMGPDNLILLLTLPPLAVAELTHHGAKTTGGAVRPKEFSFMPPLSAKEPLLFAGAVWVSPCKSLVVIGVFLSVVADSPAGDDMKTC